MEDSSKKFKFIHLNGAHVPYIYDKDMNIINELDGTYEQSAQATMVGAMDYVEHLRNSEAYDNTVLIVMSDHGYNGRPGTKRRGYLDASVCITSDQGKK